MIIGSWLSQGSIHWIYQGQWAPESHHGTSLVPGLDVTRPHSGIMLDGRHWNLLDFIYLIIYSIYPGKGCLVGDKCVPPSNLGLPIQWREISLRWSPGAPFTNMMSANSRIRFDLQIVLVCLYCTPLCKIIWRHWTYKMPVRYILSSVWIRLSIFSQLSIIQSIIQYVGLCVFSIPTPLVMIERIYTLFYYHHQIGSMNYYPLFRVRSWNNGVRCISFYILMD